MSTEARHLEYTGGSYIHEPSRPGVLSRLLPSISFYRGTVHVVVRSGMLARKGAYTSEALEDGSLSILRHAERVGAAVEVTGAENLAAAGGPCIILANHMSTLETLLIPGMVMPYSNVTFVIKPSLMKYPLFGDVMRAMRAVVLTRTNPREDLRRVFEDGERVLRVDNKSLVIFPQGERTLNVNPGGFNSIGIKLARRTGYPVVPLALRTDFWAIGSIIPDMGKIDPSKRIRFAFGPLIRDIKGSGSDEHNAVVDFIVGKHTEWTGQAARWPLMG